MRYIVLVLCIAAAVLLPVNASAQKGNQVQIGVASMITPVDAVKYYQEIIDYIGETINQPVQMVHRRTYDEMDSMLERGDVKVAFICSAPYIKNRERFGVELLVAPKVNGKTTYQSYIIAHKDGHIKSFAEMRGRSFAFTDPKSNTGKLYPTYLLKTMGTTPEKYFKRIMYSYSHNKSVELVAKKVVDGAAVESIVYEYMIKNGSPYALQTKIIKQSIHFGIPPVIVTKDISPDLKKKIKDAFINMHKNGKGRAILEAMMIEAFVDISDRSYDSIREMERAVSGDANISKKTNGKLTVYLGTVPRDNPRITYEKYQPLLDYLAEKTPYNYELVLKKNYEETVAAIGAGTVDLVFLGPLTYLEAHSRYGVTCLLKPKGIDGTASYKSVIISRKDSNISKLSELKGNKVAFSATKSTSGNLIPRYMLANNGIHLSELKRYANFDYHDSVVKAVLKGQYDAGAVRESIAKKYMPLGIKVISTSESIPTGPLVISKRMPQQASEDIKKALLLLDSSNLDHQRMLKRFDDDLKNGFTEASDNDYIGIRSKINAVPETCGIGCHPKIKL